MFFNIRFCLQFADPVGGTGGWEGGEVDTSFIWAADCIPWMWTVPNHQKTKKTKIWSSGSPAMFSIVAQIFGFFGFFGFSQWFCSTLGQPLWFVWFLLVFSMVFTSLVFGSSMLSCLGQREGPRSKCFSKQICIPMFDSQPMCVHVCVLKAFVMRSLVCLSYIPIALRDLHFPEPVSRHRYHIYIYIFRFIRI